MRIYPLALAVTLGAAVCGCSKSDKSSALAPPPPQQKDKTVFDTQLQSLEKAKGVEGTMQLDAQHLKESIDKQEAPSH
jgi:hypothetical protein